MAVASSFVAAPLIAATRPTPPLAVAFWRVALASAALAPWGGPRALRSQALAAPSGRRLALLSSLALAAHFVFWISALRLTNIAAAATLVNATPLALVALEYAAFRQTPRPGQWAGILLAVLGVCLISSGDWALSRRAIEGDGLALAGAMADAVYLVAGRALRPTLGAAPYNLVVFALAAGALGAGAGLTHVALVGYGIRVWLLLAALAAVPTLMGHALANYSLGHIPATAVGLSYLLEPVGASLLGFVWLHQVPRPEEALGGVVTLVGLALYLVAPPVVPRDQRGAGSRAAQAVPPA